MTLAGDAQIKMLMLLLAKTYIWIFILLFYYFKNSFFFHYKHCAPWYLHKQNMTWVSVKIIVLS